MDEVPFQVLTQNGILCISTCTLVRECCQVQVPAVGRMLHLCWRVLLGLFRSRARVPQLHCDLLEGRVWKQQFRQVAPRCLNLVSDHRVRLLARIRFPFEQHKQSQGNE